MRCGLDFRDKNFEIVKSLTKITKILLLENFQLYDSCSRTDFQLNQLNAPPISPRYNPTPKGSGWNLLFM